MNLFICNLKQFFSLWAKIVSCPKYRSLNLSDLLGQQSGDYVARALCKNFLPCLRTPNQLLHAAE